MGNPLNLQPKQILVTTNLLKLTNNPLKLQAKQILLTTNLLRFQFKKLPLTHAQSCQMASALRKMDAFNWKKTAYHSVTCMWEKNATILRFSGEGGHVLAWAACVKDMFAPAIGME